MRGTGSPEKSAEARANEAKSQRQRLRRNALSAREALSPAQYEAHCAAVCTHLEHAFAALAGQCIGFCWPIRNEPDLLPLIRRWYDAGDPAFRAALPVVDGPRQALVFRAWRPGDPLREDRYGIPSPVAGEPVMPAALLIPVNAFDVQAFRLGYGGGFFDRTLASLRPRPLAIGVGFELARVDSVLPQAHDIRLDAVVTEAGVFRPAGADAAASAASSCASRAP